MYTMNEGMQQYAKLCEIVQTGAHPVRIDETVNKIVPTCAKWRECVRKSDIVVNSTNLCEHTHTHTAVQEYAKRLR